MDFHRHSRTPTLLPGNSPQDEFIPTPRRPADGAFTSRLGAIRVDGMPVTESCRYPAFFDKFASQHVLSCVKEVKVTSSSRICRLNSRPFFARDELMIRRIYKTFTFLTFYISICDILQKLNMNFSDIFRLGRKSRRFPVCSMNFLT